MPCPRNLIYSCSRRYSGCGPGAGAGAGLHSGVTVRGPGQGKILVADNLVKQCDVGIHIADNSAPAVRCPAVLHCILYFNHQLWKLETIMNCIFAAS